MGLGIQRSQRELAGDCKCYEQIQENVNDLTAICKKMVWRDIREAKVVPCCLGVVLGRGVEFSTVVQPERFGPKRERFRQPNPGVFYQPIILILLF
jgi:hypothetical protein